MSILAHFPVQNGEYLTLEQNKIPKFSNKALEKSSKQLGLPEPWFVITHTIWTTQEDTVFISDRDRNGGRCSVSRADVSRDSLIVGEKPERRIRVLVILIVLNFLKDAYKVFQGVPPTYWRKDRWEEVCQISRPRKAFDRVWHPGLLYQLSTLGISEWSVKWLTSYLSERQISVRVGSTMSEYKTISCGVPQGSHLGPVLFIVFINNLPSTVRIPTEIYADDTTLHHEHSKLPSCSTYPALQEAIDCTEEWAESCNGKFGHAKMRILSTNKDIMLEAFTPTMEGQAVTVTDNHRHLAVVLSEDLKWSKHAQCILAAASIYKESRPAPSDGARPSSHSGINTLCVLCSSCAGTCQSCVARLSPGRGRNVLGTDTGQCCA